MNQCRFATIDSRVAHTRKCGADNGSPTHILALATPRLKKLFQELSELIDRRDSDVIKLVAEIKKLLGSSDIGDAFLKLESLVNSFKFEQAKVTLEQAAGELGLFSKSGVKE